MVTTIAVTQQKRAKKPLTLAMGIAMVTLAGGAVFSAANAVEPASGDMRVAGEARSFTIPAGPLSQVLNQFAGAAGVALSFDAGQLGNARSPGLKGAYTVEQGFEVLLADTGLRAIRQSNGDYVLRQVQVNMLPPVKVSAEAGERASGSAQEAYRVPSANVGVLGNTALQNTPYSVEVYSRDYIDNLQARSLSGITRYDASVSLSADDLTSENNSLMIRGITPDFDTGQKIDGLNLRSRAKDLPLEHIERVEVLKGAGGFLYGFGAPGGIVNYVLKRPTKDLTRSLSTQVTDSGLFLMHGDIGDRVGAEDRFGYRVNVVGETGETYIEGGESERKSASAAVDWRITDDLTWQVDGLYANRESYGGYWAVYPNSDGVAGNWTLGKPPAPIDGDKRLIPDWMLYESEHKILGTDLLWAFAENWNMRLSHRYSTSYRYLMNPAIFTDGAGNYSIQSFNYNNLFKSAQTQALITGTFTTGAIDHDLTAGLAYTKTVSSNSDDLGTDQFEHNLGNLSSPVEFVQTLNTLGKSDAEYWEYSRIEREEIFLSDTLHIGNSWDLIIGARHGTLEDKYGDYKESAITPTLAAIYRPRTWMSIYASYVEAFEQGAIAPATAANAGEVFDPRISKQYEIGLKIDQDNWSANAALFQLQRALTFTDSSNRFSQDGEARYEGLEVSAKKRVSDCWVLGASAMWLDASNEKTTNSTLEGKEIQGVAREQFRLYSEFDIPESSWVITAGAHYTGKRAVDADNQWYVGSITLFDLGARYALEMGNMPVTFRVNVDNATDDAYWLTTSGSGNLTQGMPRTLTLGVEVEL